MDADREWGIIVEAVDGLPAPLSLIESKFPTFEAMREELGTIQMKLRTERRGHELRLENRHLPQVTAYLMNCLAAPSDELVVRRQVRDEAQRSVEFEYSFGAGAVPGPQAAWIALSPLRPVALSSHKRVYRYLSAGTPQTGLRGGSER